MNKYTLTIDQGTSSSRAFIFDTHGDVVSVAQQPLESIYPNSGWVEQDPDVIWQSTLAVCKEAIQKAQIPVASIACGGITNQRETTVAWNKQNGEVLYNAIVWQDRRTQDYCQELQARSLQPQIRHKTGLLLDPYFSASKIHWLLENVPEAKPLAARDQLAVGTIDSFLLWRLTEGQVHATDHTNAARTLLFNIREMKWDAELLSYFAIPQTLLPLVKPCDAHFGDISAKHFGASIPITGIAGDQQAASVGQACFTPGMLKSTYGTGCFLLLNTGQTIYNSNDGLISTIAYTLNGETCYGMEGSIFNAGTAIKWLRDNLQIIDSAKQTEYYANQLENTDGVYMVPAFTGLGAPHWDTNARGAILGLSHNSGVAQIARAALESVCYQTVDVLNCMTSIDTEHTLQEIRVDGGMVCNNWLLQFLADMTQLPIQRPHNIETTALGAAWIAGLGAGIYSDLNEVKTLWKSQQAFKPTMPETTRQVFYAGWQDAIGRVMASSL